jgi:hypothetical protein
MEAPTKMEQGPRFKTKATHRKDIVFRELQRHFDMASFRKASAEVAAERSDGSEHLDDVALRPGRPQDGVHPSRRGREQEELGG